MAHKPIAHTVGDLVGRMMRQVFKPSGRGYVAQLNDLGITVQDTFVVSIVLVIVLLNTDTVWIVITLDKMGGTTLPLLGWLLIGLTVGCVLSVTARVREFGWFRSVGAVHRVPDIEHLRAGENTADTIWRGKLILGTTAITLACALVLASWWTNSRYPEKLDTDQIIDRVRETAGKGDIASSNRALNDAVVRLENSKTSEGSSNHSTALRVLNVIKSFDNNTVNRPIRRVAQAASYHINVYRTVTNDMVKGDRPGALDRASAFLEVDRKDSVFWLGQLYEFGRGGARKDLLKAFAYYDEGEKLGDNASGAALELLAKQTIGDTDDHVRQASFSYFDLKAKTGDPLAQYWLGKWYEQDQTNRDSRNKSIEMLIKAASQESHRAAQIFAFIDLTKSGGSNQMARSLLDKLAPVFATGNNMEAKLAAYIYFETRAHEGDPGAQLWTGYRYREGDGIAKDLSKAQIWFAKAATQDSNQVVKQRALAALFDSQKGTR